MSADFAQRWPDIEIWLDRALEQPLAKRRAWLAAHCGDEALRSLVLGLLDADARHGARIDACASASHEWVGARAHDLPQVPGYRLLNLLGEGGMASVFLAERILGDTVQRVAIKRLRLNVYDPAERRRFEHEHRILARLEHPCIARLVDAGIAPDGVPWFAMEYVRGEPLVAWCDARRLDVEGRLALLGSVALAIHHAHQYLVVHRDLKPSNVLVDDEGTPKVLDFGIARLLDPDTGGAEATNTAQRRLTPGYAAPEQYVGVASTATDVYALGVLLVELITGSKPAPIRNAGSDPLVGVSATASAAVARSMTVRAVRQLLSGEVGAIARKALRDDPALRYGSAHAFAEDLDAIRARRPVSARRGEWRYRALCFVRRNKATVLAGALVTATLLAATGVSLTQAQRARQQAERAHAVQVFVEDMLAPLREGVPRARMPPLDRLLAMGVARLDRDGGRDPAVYSELLVMFARTYDRMGEIDTARTLAVRAYRHSAAAFGADDVRTLEALAMRGRMHARFGERSKARADLEAARTRMQRAGTRGVEMAMVLDDLGDLALGDEDAAAAKQLYTNAQQQRATVLGPEHRDLALGPANLGEVANAAGDKRAALGLYRQAWQHCATNGHAQTREAALYLSRSGLLQCELGAFRSGARDYLQALAIFEQLDARDHPERMQVLVQSCSAFVFLDELERAAPDCAAAVAMAARLYGEGSVRHDQMRVYRLKLLAAQGQLRKAHAEAAALRARLLSRSDAKPGGLITLNRMYSDTLALETDPKRVQAALLPVAAHPGVERWIMAPTLFARLLLACERAPSPDCPTDLDQRVRQEFAEPQFQDNPLLIDPLLTLAQLALDHDDPAQAHRHLDEIQRLAQLPHARLRPDHRWLAQTRMLRGEAWAAQQNTDEARREWAAAAVVFASRYDADHPLRQRLAAHLQRAGAAR